MKKEIADCIKRLQEIFPKAFIYKENELIVEPKNNVYFRIDNIDSELEFKCKIVEWLSRPACKGLSKYWQKQIRTGMNRFLETNFTVEELRKIYTYLGCCCSRSKTLLFVKSNYDMSVLG